MNSEMNLKSQSDNQAQSDVFVFPTSFAQQRLWIMDQLEPGNAAYNLPIALRLHGRLDPGLLARVFTETPGLFFERFGLAGLHAALAWVVVVPALAWVLRRLLLPTFRRLATLSPNP